MSDDQDAVCEQGVPLEGMALVDAGLLSRDDIRQITAIHMEQIPEGFLTSLGGHVLQSLFGHLSRSRWGLLIAAREIASGEVRGFVCGTMNTRKLYGEFLRQSVFLVVTRVAPRLVTWRRLRKAAESLLYPLKRDFRAAPSAELLDFAIADEWKGTGLAGSLFRAFVETMDARGVHGFRISTGAAMYRAQAFYEKMGAVRLGPPIEIHRGSETHVYTYHMRSKGAHDETDL